MKKIAKIVLFGIAMWASIFIGAMFIFTLRDSDRLFFETLIGLILVLFVTLYSIFYFKKINEHFVRNGVQIGIGWMLVNLAVDIPMFSFGPMSRPLWDYFKDIGFAYFSIPVITIGMGYLLDHKSTGATEK